MKKIILLLFCMPLLLATTCEDENESDIFCTTEFVYGLNVTVLDSQTLQPIVDGVAVSITSGNYQETLTVLTGGEFVFSGAGERPGSYIITITKSGYTTFTSETIILEANECHVIPQQVTVSLVAN